MCHFVFYGVTVYTTNDSSVSGMITTVFAISFLSGMLSECSISGAGCCLQVVIVKLKMDKDRKAILERKARARQKLEKGKHTEESIMETS